jgi:hypothetical protein
MALMSRNSLSLLQNWIPSWSEMIAFLTSRSMTLIASFVRNAVQSNTSWSDDLEAGIDRLHAQIAIPIWYNRGWRYFSMQKAETRPKNDNKPLHLSGRQTGLDIVPITPATRWMVPFSNSKSNMQTNGRAELKTVVHAVSNNRWRHAATDLMRTVRWTGLTLAAENDRNDCGVTPELVEWWDTIVHGSDGDPSRTEKTFENKAMHAKPSIDRFDLRWVNCSGWVIAVVLKFKSSMQTSWTADFKTVNHAVTSARWRHAETDLIQALRYTS